MKNMITVMCLMAMTSVGCTASDFVRNSADGGADAGSNESSQIRKDNGLQNAMTASETIIYANE